MRKNIVLAFFAVALMSISFMASASMCTSNCMNEYHSHKHKGKSSQSGHRKDRFFLPVSGSLEDLLSDLNKRPIIVLVASIWSHDKDRHKKHDDGFSSNFEIDDFDGLFLSGFGHHGKRNHHFNKWFDHDSSFYCESTPEVPVPAAVWLFGSGLIGLSVFARRKNRS